MPRAGRLHRELPPRLHRARDTEGTQLCPRGTRDRGGWVGWVREKAKPGATSFSVWVGFKGRKGKRGRKATAWKRREPHGRFSEKKEGM